MKVVCIHGTESGGSERHAKRLSKSWPKANFDQSKDFMSGNDAASVGLEALAAKYDAFVIVSSSYGDGDPPSNFENFLRALYTADEGVLAGKQHCVLGYGSTDYETFQNCPRLTDKLMGALGAKRMLARVEVDENETLTGDEAVAKWAKDVVAAFSKTCKADVCDWTVPEAPLVPSAEAAATMKGADPVAPAWLHAARRAASASCHEYAYAVPSDGALDALAAPGRSMSSLLSFTKVVDTMKKISRMEKKCRTAAHG